MATEYISKIKLPGGETTYSLKDTEARELIQKLGSPMHFVGIATNEITDGSTSKPTDEGTYEGASGDVTTYGTKEFIWDGSKWCELGDLGTLGKLAYYDKATVTPKGAVTVNAITPEGTINNGAITISEQTATSTFTGKASAVTGTGTGNIDIPTTATVSAGEETTAEITPSGEISVVPGIEEYVKTVAAPTVTSTFTGTSANVVGATTTANKFSASVAEELLTFTEAAGTVTGGTVTATGSVTSTATAPELTKGAPTVTATFSGSASSVDVSSILEGLTVSLETESKPVNVTVSGTTTSAGDVKTTVTKATASQEASTFEGSEIEITANFVGSESQVNFSSDAE